MLLTNSTNSESSRSLQEVLLEQGQRVVLSPFVLASLYETHLVLRASAVGRDGFFILHLAVQRGRAPCAVLFPADACVSLLRGLLLAAVSCPAGVTLPFVLLLMSKSEQLAIRLHVLQQAARTWVGPSGWIC